MRLLLWGPRGEGVTDDVFWYVIATCETSSIAGLGGASTGVNIPQSVVWHYQPPHHPPHAHSTVSGSRSAAPPCGMPASWGSIDHVRLGPSSASLPTPTPQNAIVPHQSFESKNDALSTSHIQAARPPPQALNPANPAPSGVSSQGPDISRLLATSLPSADEKVLQGKVSELRVALQQTHTRAESATREVHNMWSKLQQSEQASSQYQARVYDLEKALELARAQLHGQMGGIGFAMGHDAAQMIDIVRGPQLTGAMAEVRPCNQSINDICLACTPSAAKALAMALAT